MKVLLILCLFMFGGLLESCTAPNIFNAATENVTFVLPSWQSDLGFPALDHWEITTIGLNDYDTENSSITQKQKIPSTENCFCLTVPKNKIVAITARPITKNSNDEQTVFFYPAGTVYPNLTIWNGHNAENLLTWEDGFTAKVIELIYGSAENSVYSETTITNFIEKFNWKKFSEVIFAREEKDSEKFYNPWRTDLSSLIEKLLSKKFNANAMNTKNIVPLQIENIVAAQTQFPEINLISQYIPENNFIAKTQSVSVSTMEINNFLCNNDYIMLVTVKVNYKGEKKVLTEVVFLPKIIEDEF